MKESGWLLAAFAVVAAGVVASTRLLNTTKSTTALDRYRSVEIEGDTVPLGNIVAGRVHARFHPLPWLGTRITEAERPGPLAAKVGAELTCAARAGDRQVAIPVSALDVADGNITWIFER